LKILIACEFSGIVRNAFNQLGYDAVSCDLLDSEIPGNHIKGDILDILDQGWDLMIAHPPCTHLSVSGARWFKDKILNGLQPASVGFAYQLWKAPIDKIAIENPVSVLSNFLGKPTQIIQPYEFGHGETKKTCLWLKNLKPLKPTKIVSGRDNRIHKEPPSKERWKNRSRFYPGIAEAMVLQWLHNG
jgi:hypothetical protein